MTVRTAWFDYLLVVALLVLVLVAGSNLTLPRSAGPCNWKTGDPCGCHPEVGKCSMPCNGCCPHGCWPTKGER